MDVNIVQSARSFRVLTVALLALLSGCGGNDFSAPPPSVGGGAQAPAPVQAAAPAGDEGSAPAGQQEVAERPAQDPVSGPGRPSASVDFDQLPPDTYLLGVDASNYVLPMEPVPDPATQFVLQRGPAGSVVDSSQFWLDRSANTGTGATAATASTFVPPAGFTSWSDAPVNEAGLPLAIRCEIDYSVMRLVTGAVYVQGSDFGEANAGPAHSAIVDSFYMDSFEVTLGQYRQFRSAMREARESVPPEPANPGDPDSHPVLGVTWRDARRYAEWAGKSLPSEAEWELAARGPHSFPYVWGTTRPVWPRTRNPGQIDRVGSFPTDCSVFGIYDLAGNAREWCLDHYSEQAYTDAFANDGGPLRNWSGPSRASVTGHRVVRGSSTHWETWVRAGHSMSESSPDIGFRCVLRLAAPEQAAEETEAEADAPVSGSDF